jgi:hypothetical protein
MKKRLLVNLVRFDPAHAKKRGLAIVTADTIVRTTDEKEIIIRAHQAVSNPSTSTTLLSENQMRHAGHLVDSVHTDHLSKGTQALYSQVDDEGGTKVYKIPFVQRKGLMTFQHRRPDVLDYDRGLEIVPTTLEGR